LGVRFCVYATAIRRGPKPGGIIAGSDVDDARPLWVADGVLHGASAGDEQTLCGLPTKDLHQFADNDFETVSISDGRCAGCARAAEQSDV
jgi:hypothetical protein